MIKLWLPHPGLKELLLGLLLFPVIGGSILRAIFLLSLILIAPTHDGVIQGCIVA